VNSWRASAARSVLCAVALVTALLVPVAASAQVSASCSGAVRCSTVTVPVDRAGRVAGTVALHVEVAAPKGMPRGLVFLVAGGPGQASAATFDLANADARLFYQTLFPGYTLVAFDPRGTGKSARLHCPSLEQASDASMGVAVASCAAQLGPQSAFYRTADHAADLDAVRQALGADRITIWGVSYGTKLALAYASAFPQHLDRLLLDSVVADDASPFRTSMLQAMPATLGRYGAPSFAADVVALANRLATTPLDASVRELDGRSYEETLDALDFLGVVTDADSNPGLAVELPAATHAALAGDPLPLLHAANLDGLGSSGGGDEFSTELYLATVCDDGPFPWQPETPIAERAALVQAAIAAQPSAFGPFGPWAADFGGLDLCTNWPTPASTPATTALPDVPVLALSGGLDLRTPTSGAASVVARFPHGHLLVVPSVGHSVLTADLSGCSMRAVRAWMLTGAIRSACPKTAALMQPLAAFPPGGTQRLGTEETRSIALKTVRDAEAVWLSTAGMSGQRIVSPGIHGGRVIAKTRSIALDGYSIAPGVAVTGTVILRSVGPPLRFIGVVHVGGGRAAAGVVVNVR
jgi:pimeloyl-ACP methyl ester carboxylesterase